MLHRIFLELYIILTVLSLCVELFVGCRYMLSMQHRGQAIHPLLMWGTGAVALMLIMGLALL